MSRSSDSSSLERSTSPSRSDASNTTTSSQDASSDTQSRSPSPCADRTGLPVPSPWASPYGPPLGHCPMPIMGYPLPPFPFLPPLYPSPHPMGCPPPRHPGPSHKSTERENGRLRNKVRDLERQLKKQQPKQPQPTSPWRRKRSRSTSPAQNTRPRTHFKVEVARSVKRPGHPDPHNTPGYNKQHRWLSVVHPRPSPQPVQVPLGRVTITLEPNPPAIPRFGAYWAPTPPKPNNFWPLSPRPNPRP